MQDVVSMCYNASNQRNFDAMMPSQRSTKLVIIILIIIILIIILIIATSNHHAAMVESAHHTICMERGKYQGSPINSAFRIAPLLMCASSSEALDDLRLQKLIFLCTRTYSSRASSQEKG